MRISVVIPHFYAVREPNLPVLVERLLAGSHPPAEILIWNNDRPLSVALPPIVSVIQSPRNIGCQARFLAALMSAAGEPGGGVLFQDNDVAVRAMTLQALAREAALTPRAVWTLDGRTSNGEPYRRWHKVRHVTARERVTMSLGRCELIAWRTLRELLAVFPFGEDAAMDDLALSGCAQRLDIPIYVPATAEDERIDKLPEHGVGCSRTPAYYDRRQAVAGRVFSGGSA